MRKYGIYYHFEQMKAQHAVENLKFSLAQHLFECIHGTFDDIFFFSFRQNVNVELKYKIPL